MAIKQRLSFLKDLAQTVQEATHKGKFYLSFQTSFWILKEAVRPKAMLQQGKCIILGLLL